MENRVLWENCHRVINKKWKRKHKKKEQRCCRKPANWKRRTYSCDFLPSLRGNVTCALRSSTAHRGLFVSSIHASETRDIVMEMFAPCHISEWPCTHRLACTDRRMAVKDNSPEPCRDLLPGDHMKIKVTVCFLPVGSICLAVLCGWWIKTQKRWLFSIKAVMKCSFASASLK